MALPRAQRPDVKDALLWLIQLFNQQEIGVEPAEEQWDAAIQNGRVALGMEPRL